MIRTISEWVAQKYTILYLQLALAVDRINVRLERAHSSIYHLIDNRLGGFLLIDNCRGLAHEERSCVVHSIIIDIITQALHVPFNGDVSLGGEIFDLLLPVLLPILDVRIVPYSKRATGKDNGANVVIEASSANSLLMSTWSTSFL